MLTITLWCRLPNLVVALGVWLAAASASALVTVVTSGSIPANSKVTDSASCPGGQVALSGSVDHNDFQAMFVLESAPLFAGGVTLLDQSDGASAAPIGWRVRIDNPTSAERSYKLAVICDVDDGSTLVQSLGGASSNAAVPSAVSCPVGLSATGGGVTSDSDLVNVSGHGPLIGGSRMNVAGEGSHSPGADGWYGSVQISDGNSHAYRVGAVCRVGSNTTVVKRFGASPGATGVDDVFCPTGQFAVGGGVDTGNFFTLQLTASGVNFGPGGAGDLLNQPDGTLGAPNGWQVAVFNTDSLLTNSSVGVICLPEPMGVAWSAVPVGAVLAAGWRRRADRSA